MNALVYCHRRSLVILLLLAFAMTANSQLTAKFSASPQSGCSPLVISFTDESLGNPTQWRWDLGNGVISTLKNPSTTYFNAGSYTVKLVVKNASGTDSLVKTNYVTVNPNPVVKFSASDTAGCFPLPVKFTDQSTTNSGTITNWQWDFGDGAVSNVQHPSHVYTASGDYAVTLRVTNSFGCTKVFSQTQFVTVSNGVKAGFTNDMPGTCKAPVIIQFTNTSTGPGALTYAWDFGDGTTSNEKDPSHTYTANGSFTVSLVTISAQGCRDTVVKKNFLNLGTNKTSFSVKDTLCKDATASFTNTSLPNTSSALWYFGDGGTSTDINATHTYSAPGIYTVKLVNNFGSCTDSIEKKVLVVNKPKASFTTPVTSFCKVPSAVSFSSTSTGAVAYNWDFGDGSTGTGNAPSHTYTAEGVYTVTLVAINSNGCTDTIVKKDLIKVKKPQISLSGLPRTGCTPLVVSPKATVISDEPIVSYLWNFGNGSTSTAVNPTHTYTGKGTYAISLTVTTASGCSDTYTFKDAVKVGTKPSASFTVAPNDVCAFKPVKFNDTSKDTVDKWSWNFGDGGFTDEQNPQYTYSDTGWFNVQLIVWNNTCPDTVLVKKAVYIRPPIAAYSIDLNCDNKFSRNFTDGSIGAETWSWNFGDGTSSTLQNPSHTYVTAGTYAVTLVVTNGSCSNKATKNVRIIDQKSLFAVQQPVICKNDSASFIATNIKASEISSWSWDFGDGTSSTDSIAAKRLYAKSGTYTVTLTITDHNNCTSVSTQVIKVNGAVADFTTSLPAACLYDNNVQFTDASATDGEHAIIKRLWSFGDGVVDANNKTLLSHHYDSTGTYDLSLTVTDAFGCTDKQTKTAALTIAQPKAAFVSADTLSCTDATISFQNNSEGSSLQYLWNFGDQKLGVDANPVHTYGSIGVYSVNLLVTDQYGCKDSASRPSYITISQPIALFTVSDSIGTCPPMMVKFTNSSTNYTSFHWDFGDGTTSDLLNPSHFYTSVGTYFPTLTVSGPGGCTDVYKKKIVVKGPSGSFSYTPLAGCKPLEVSFTATSANIASYIWDFSDGNTFATTNSQVKHTYSVAGDFVPKMILIDADGCNVSITGTDTIRVTGIEASFTSNGNRFCDATTVSFTNTTTSNDYVKSYLWNFGDGSTSTEEHPSHHYANAGTYNVSLTAVTENGCTDSIFMKEAITILARPDIAIVANGGVCAPSLYQVSGQLESGSLPVVDWQWNFGNGQTASGKTPADPMFTNAGNFNIIAVATGANGCKDTAQKAIEIFPVPNTNAGADQAICKGSFATLTATGAERYVWNAASSLSCTDCPSPLAAPSDATTYVVTGYTGKGCFQSDTVMVTVHQPFTMLAEPGDTLCVGESIRLQATGADLYSWSPASVVANPGNGATIARPSATTTFQVIGKDKYNCFSDTATVFVKVYPMPTVDAGPDQTLVVGNTATLSPAYSPDVVYYKWMDGTSLDCNNCRVPVAQPKRTTTYTLEVMNQGGCKATDQMTIFVVCGKGNLYIPNTFSPNGDGVNDRFYPSGSGINMIKNLRVFNRWGEVVFERSNFSANEASMGWDGTFKGQSLPPDVYVYTCDVLCQNNEVLQYNGDVTLLK